MDESAWDRLVDLDAYIEEMDARTVQRGVAYQAERRVRSLNWSPDRTAFEASVRGGSVYSVVWRDGGRDLGWSNTCTCPVGGDCKHAVAAAAEAIQRWSATSGGNPAAAVPPASARDARELAEDPATGEAALLERLAAEHGRALKSTEKAVVRRLTRVYGDMLRREEIDGHEIGRFARTIDPGLGYDAHVPRDLLEEVVDPRRPPATLLELWQILAVMFRERGWGLPAVLLPVTDTTTIDQRLAVRRKARELERWTRWFHRLDETVSLAEPPRAMRRLRLVLANKGLQFQAEDESSGEVAVLKTADINEIFSPYSRGDLVRSWDSTSLVLVETFREFATHGWTRAATLQDPTVRRCLARAVVHPELSGRILDAAGQPFRPAAGPLIWRLSPEPGDDARVLLELVREDGGPVPSPLVHLGGSPDLYLGGGEIFRGPPPLHAERPDAGWKASLPASLLHDERIVRALVRRRAILPEAVAARVEAITLRPLIRAQLTADAFGNDAIGVIFTAVDALGRRRLTFTPSGWTDSFMDVRPEAGRTVVPDIDSLQPATAQFRSLGFQWGGDPGRWLRGVHAQTPHELVAWFAGFPEDTIFELAPELAALRKAPVRADFALAIEESGRDWFDVELVVKASDTELTPEELELLLKAQGRWVRLGARGWRRIALSADDAQQAKLAELGLSPDGVLPGRQRYHALQLASAGLDDLASDAAWQRVKERARSIAALPAPEAPAGFTGDLRPYQHEGFHFLAHLSANSLGGILADDMGLGKTVQALAWLLWLAQRTHDGKPLRALVVCPKSVASNWEREAARFAPGLRVSVFQPRIHKILPADAHVVVANYAQLRACDERFRAVSWTAVILDEGQNIKNPKSQTADVARRLSAAHRIVLTGTPIENRVLDLWSLFAFAMPGLLGGQTQFKKLYDDRKDPTARVRLARRVRHFLLRRTKAQVAQELPPRVEEDIVCELEGDQRRLYDAELKRARQLVLGVKDKRGFDAQRFNILQSLLRLRQICCHPSLLGADYARESAKVGALFEQIETILEEGHKVLIFSQFVSMLELLARELTERGVGFLTITGQTEDRQRLVDDFQTSPEKRVFLLSLKAAGAGLNLTAASYVVLFDPWWNPAVEAQAIDRTHRIGQVNPVVAYRLIAKDTVEEKIRALQRAKAELARAVVQEESLASVMNLDDLRYVLG